FDPPPALRRAVPPAGSDNDAGPAAFHLVGDAVRRLDLPRAPRLVTRIRRELLPEAERVERPPDAAGPGQQGSRIRRRPGRRQRDLPACRLAAAADVDANSRRPAGDGKGRSIAAGTAWCRGPRAPVRVERHGETRDAVSLPAEHRDLQEELPVSRDSAGG